MNGKRKSTEILSCLANNRDMTLEQIAKKFGITQQNVSYYKRKAGLTVYRERSEKGKRRKMISFVVDEDTFDFYGSFAEKSRVLRHVVDSWKDQYIEKYGKPKTTIESGT